jgi:hypothetical protein
LAPPIRARVRGPFDPLGSNGRERDQPYILPRDRNVTFNFILSRLFVSSHIGT